MGAGTQTAAMIATGLINPPISANTELWNGSSWTEVNDVNDSKILCRILLVILTTAAIACWWRLTRKYARHRNNGMEVHWTEVNNLNTARELYGASGSSTLAIAFGGDGTT